jgi:hypothetical protein
MIKVCVKSPKSSNAVAAVIQTSDDDTSNVVPVVAVMGSTSTPVAYMPISPYNIIEGSFLLEGFSVVSTYFLLLP